MRTFRVVEFVKTKACPPSEALLHYITRTLGAPKLDAINTHLSACDFCGAETQLLTRFPPPQAPVSFGVCEMPLPLRHLAEDVMFARPFKRIRFFETRHEIGRLTLTDA